MSSRLPFKYLRPPIALECSRPAQICDSDGAPLFDAQDGPWLADLSGGAATVEWAPSLRIVTSSNQPSVERGLDWYRLRVWKRRHGPLDVTDGTDSYKDPAYTDPWADWLEQHADWRFRMCDVEFVIYGMEPYRNGINFWMQGRKVIV